MNFQFVTNRYVALLHVTQFTGTAKAEASMPAVLSDASVASVSSKGPAV